VEKDYAKAAEWYGKAAAQNYAVAIEALDKMKTQGLV
jgi:TPR repeat protein